MTQEFACRKIIISQEETESRCSTSPLGAEVQFLEERQVTKCVLVPDVKAVVTSQYDTSCVNLQFFLN